LVAPPGADGFYDSPDPGVFDVAIQEVITTNVTRAAQRLRGRAFCGLAVDHLADRSNPERVEVTT
jgi:hypothetical protein